MDVVTSALQNIRRDDTGDIQHILHLIQLIQSDDKRISDLLTLSPSCLEVFDWWNKGSGQHVQSGVCFSLFSIIIKSVLQTHDRFDQQAVSICRKLLKERLHSVYGALSKYSHIKTQKSCLEFLGLQNILSKSLTKLLITDFNFGNASLKHMLSNNGAVHLDALRFMLSFLCTTSMDSKVKFMTMKNILKTMTQKINNDNVAVKLELVTIISQNILVDSKLAKKIKCQFFSVPALAEIAQFVTEPNADLQSQTLSMFKKLFDYKTGVLFKCSPSDVFCGTSSNPILVNFIKRINFGIEPINDFLIHLVPVCLEVSQVLLNRLVSNTKINSTEVLTNLHKTLQARSIGSILDIVTNDISDSQLFEQLVPKSMTDLIEKKLKSRETDPLLYLLIITLVESASVAVDRFSDRQDLPDLCMYNLPDISVIQSAGLLNTRLASCYLRIDKYCLILHKVDVSSLITSTDVLSDEDINFLTRLLPSQLFTFLKSNSHVLLQTFCGNKTIASQDLFRKCILASKIVSDEDCISEVNVLISSLFHNHDKLYIGKIKLKKKLCDEKTMFLTLFLEAISNNPQCLDFSTILGKFSVACPTTTLLVKELLHVPFHRDLSCKNYQCVAALCDAPVYFLALYSITDMHSSKDILSSDNLPNALRILEVAVEYLQRTPNSMPVSLHTIIMDLINTENDEPLLLKTLSNILSTILNSSNNFSSAEILACIALGIEDELIIEMMARSCIDSENESTLLVDIINHSRVDSPGLLNIMNFSDSHSFIDNNNFIGNVLKLFDPSSKDDMSMETVLDFITKYTDTGDNNTLFDFVSKDKLIMIYQHLINLNIYQKEINKDSMGILIELSEYLHSASISNSDWTISLAHFETLQDTSFGLEPWLPHLKVYSKSEAETLIHLAFKHYTLSIFLLPEYQYVIELSEFFKNKKHLKELLEFVIKNAKPDELGTFLSQYASLYEENLPAFTRKTVKNMFVSSIQLESTATVEIFIILLSAFPDILPEGLLKSVFTTFIESDSVKDMITSSSETPFKVSMSNLFAAIFDTHKVPTTSLTLEHYSLFQSAYNATDSPTDQKILRVLKYFEEKNLISKYPFAYGPLYVAELKQASCNLTLYNEYCIKIIENLDKQRLQNLVDNFPLHSSDNTKCSPISTNSLDSYNAEFILSLIYYILFHSDVDVRTLLFQPIIQVPLLAISSYNEITRRVGYACLEKISYLIEEENFKEKSMCSYIFSMLRNSITSDNERVPHLTVYFIGKMLLTMAVPNKHIYPKVCYFLLQRPVFDFYDVPMFYTMFCSSDMNYKEDQAWLLKLLVIAVRDEADYKILSRRHVLPLCISQIGCPGVDKYTAKLIQQLISKVCAMNSTKVQKDLNELGIFKDCF